MIHEFIGKFDFEENIKLVKIDFTHAHLSVRSAIASFYKVVINFCRNGNGTEINVVGLNQASATLMNKLAMHNQVDSFENFVSH